MTKTENFHLNQWEPHDEIRVEDFNADNAAVDAALNSLNTALSGCAKVVTGSYVGTGKHGSSNPVTLTFDFAPKMVVIWTENYKAASTSGNTIGRVGYWGSTFAVLLPNVSSVQYSTGGTDAVTTVLSFSGNSVQYYCTSYAQGQWNTSGTTYYYLSIGV